MKILKLLFFILLPLIFSSCGKDSNPPVITLLGKNPATTGVGITYQDAGATAFDEEDGDITSKIVVDNQVDNSKPGTCYVYYNVTDSDGNKAEQVSREVIIKYY
jgi:hypothetical protein